MLLSSGGNDDTQWFDYRADFFGQVQRIEWDKGTMFAALPHETASWLIRNGYARPMTDEEVEEYTKPSASEPTPAPETPARTPKKGAPP